jgi:N-acetyl sugar amidotransferase
VRYCSRCILPETRPNLVLGADGVCNACEQHARRTEAVDWDERARLFADVVRRARERSKGYDCLIPVSGGKDSTWQVATCLEHGLKPLAVTWRAPGRNETGTRNLANLVSLGVDHVDYSIDPGVERRFAYEALVRLGQPATPMHMAMHKIPLTLAVALRIPLVVWGENSAAEYGATEPRLEGFRLDAAWFARYGVTGGTTARDWVSERLSERDLTPYFGPSEDELERAGVEAVFLGEFFRWDPERILAAALAAGFRPRAEGPKVGIYDFADIDDDFISVHHFFKWFKFGFTRSWDNLSLEIRNGRMTRDEAIASLRARGDETPHEDIEAFCAFLDISRGQFFEVAERFRNLDVWRRRGDGAWVIDDFLIPDWTWS